jgi:hypothetical protein
VGYTVHTENVDFLIPSESVEAALVGLRDDLVELREGQSARDALITDLEEEYGFEIACGAEGVRIVGYDGKSHEEEEVVEKCSPFAVEGSYLEWRGEDDCRWRWEVRGGRLYTQYPKVQWVDCDGPVAQPEPRTTDIAVMYRDGCNYKAHGVIRLEGVITPSQLAALRDALDDGLYYAPLQLGLTHLGGIEWSSFPGDDDHGYHEMLLDEIEIRSGEPCHGCVVDHGGTVAEFIAAVQAAARSGWDPSLDGCTRLTS